MEKFSAFRDPGTGIQPFLRPVPPTDSELLANIALPFGYVAGAIRTAVVIALGILYVILVAGVCTLLKPVPSFHRIVSHAFTAAIARLVLLALGLLWIPVKIVTRKRGRGAKVTEKWSPAAGDIIISNWVSTIELLWLAFRVNPIFLLPICSSTEFSKSTSQPASPISRTPGRRTGTGSAAISSPSARAPIQRVPFVGFRRASLLSILRATGNVPSTASATPEFQTLEQIRSQADRPIVVFPECTTSNGRGLLRFAELFPDAQLPVTAFKVFVMCVRYDPPTIFCPTLSHPIPSAKMNPLPQLFSLSTSLVPHTMSIRLLTPSESPSSRSFLASDFLTGNKVEDELTEVCASLIAQIGKMKRIGLGWEDKAAFLEFYNHKRR
ncbi:uncharacterized protein LAESUDRAFT_733399 [Laetiporus sulphureus 93-53]|uniref:Phospholipid/glycerol acyltransferase domain-containing protein n=1 Tax=Laetiporus sulphureus 93-53 TaxID=1314785 RepID=A0A165IAF0_9APHY|nr:uncharacterized protein LAESUDRAFT_733399 [Laetiporus sulphureus 93-53]KZT12802.1 hypothetical protein LAESUDRAFT_733399 [Laetiporus sulphureus 93-53]